MHSFNPQADLHAHSTNICSIFTDDIVQGAQIMRKFRYMLNPRQVFDLADGGPMAGFAIMPRFIRVVSATFIGVMC